MNKKKSKKAKNNAVKENIKNINKYSNNYINLSNKISRNFIVNPIGSNTSMAVFRERGGNGGNTPRHYPNIKSQYSQYFTENK